MLNLKELAAPVLALAGLVGLVVLLALGKDVSVLLPLETALLGLVVGLKKDVVAGKLSAMLKKK